MIAHEAGYLRNFSLSYDGKLFVYSAGHLQGKLRDSDAPLYIEKQPALKAGLPEQMRSIL